MSELLFLKGVNGHHCLNQFDTFRISNILQMYQSYGLKQRVTYSNENLE